MLGLSTPVRLTCIPYYRCALLFLLLAISAPLSFRMVSPGCEYAQVARVNCTGQFILRELLESGQSSTHRLSVRKVRIIFLLNISDLMQPQIVSRAHEVVHCSD